MQRRAYRWLSGPQHFCDAIDPGGGLMSALGIRPVTRERDPLRRSRRAALIVVCALWPGVVAPPAAAESPAGRVFTLAGTHSDVGPMHFGAPATRINFRAPTAILAMPDGGFLFGDLMRSRVVRVDANGRIHRFIGNGHDGDGGNEGPATRASMWVAGALVRRSDGSIVMLDEISGQLRVVTPDGVIHRLYTGGSGRANRGLAVLPTVLLNAGDGGAAAGG
jgi:hypothetical protein